MSSKDKSKTSSDKIRKDASVKSANNKSRDKQTKIDDDKLIFKEEKPTIKSETKVEHKRHKIKTYDELNKSDRDIKKVDNDNQDEREERRRRRKEREVEADNVSKSGKEIDRHSKDIDKERKRSDKRDENERNYKKEKKDDNQYDSKHRLQKEESGSTHKGDKVESSSRQKLPKDDSMALKNKVEKEDSNLDSRVEKDDRPRHRSDREKSGTKHKSSKDDNLSRHSEKNNKSNENRKTSRSSTDARGDNRGLTEGLIRSEKGNRKYSTQTSESKIIEDPEHEEYDEDFDEYNDDFDEVNSSSTPVSGDKEIYQSSSRSPSPKEVPQAPAKRQQTETNADSKKQDGIHASFINFRMAQKKCSNDVIANKMLSRAFDLSRLIELDKSHFDIVDVAPVLEHSQYMLLFGRAGSQHIGSQTHDDNMAREIQTEVIEERTVCSQHPPLDDEGPVKVINDTSQNQLGSFQSNQSITKTALQMLSEAGTSSASLIQILDLMDHVLEEEASPEVTTKTSSSENGGQPMSSGYNKYSLEGSMCTLATFSSGNSGVFATVHQKAPQSKDDKSVRDASTISVWRVSSYSREPQRVLSCSSPNRNRCSFTSVTFSPDPSSSHVIAGLDSGLVALWDLREPFSPTESPAYLTASHINNHKGPVIALHASSSEGASGSTYQLLSVDSTGVLSTWVVTSLTQGGHWALASGSLADLCLRPGSRARVSLVSSVSLVGDPQLSMAVSAATSLTCMAVDVNNPSHVFVGTHDGRIIHHERVSTASRGHSRARMYGSQTGFESAVITRLDCYPFFEPYLLAGYDDGSLRVFQAGRTEPLLSLCDRHRRSPVIACRWSQSHPALVVSLDASGTLSIWNLLASLYQPVLTQAFPGRVGFDLSADSRWQTREDRTVAPVATNKARLLLWAIDGVVEVHELHPAFVVPELDDLFRTCALLQSLL